MNGFDGLYDCIMYFLLCHICSEFNYLVVVYLHSIESALTNLNCQLFKLILYIAFLFLSLSYT